LSIASLNVTDTAVLVVTAVAPSAGEAAVTAGAVASAAARWAR
jgi:hypothetical protein